jgi:hypothetical protein
MVGSRIVGPEKTGITNAENLTIIDKCIENLTKGTMKGRIGDYLGGSPGVESSDVEVTELSAKA